MSESKEKLNQRVIGAVKEAEMEMEMETERDKSKNKYRIGNGKKWMCTLYKRVRKNIKVEQSKAEQRAAARAGLTGSDPYRAEKNPDRDKSQFN